MDRTRFDALARACAPGATRRRVLRLLLGAVAAGAGIASADAMADRNRKRKSRCPADRRCGKKCCPKGRICASGVCVTGQGVCPPGADFCAQALYVCGGVGDALCVCVTTAEGDTRCVQTPASTNCGTCTTSADCAHVGPGAVCIGAGGNCCSPGQGECVTPCLVSASFAASGPSRRAAQAVAPDSAMATALRHGLAGGESGHR